MSMLEPIGGSFRDPSGQVYVSQGTVYRQVNLQYQKTFDRLISCGLYDELVRQQLLVSHRETSHVPEPDPLCYKVLHPEQIPLVSYPYEWSFSQLKDAALATLDIQNRALNYGMILKDASAYNVQFYKGKPILIDTLSFAVYRDGEPWVAYKQFCQHFLGPLALMSYRDIRLSQLLRVHLDGIPLDLVTSLLPSRAWLNSGIVVHLRLHAMAQRRYAGKIVSQSSKSAKKLNKRSLLNIVDDLRSTIERFSWKHDRTSWMNYYEGNSYDDEGNESKQEIVSEFLTVANPKCVWDLGANEGRYSRLAAETGAFTVSMDNDPGVVEANYLKARRDHVTNLLPLLVDLANPSAGIGWANVERDSLLDRCNADCIMALALIHHIAISNNVPLSKTAAFFASLAEWLIIEFVPKTDTKAQQLLASREDIFDHYLQSEFEREYQKHYEIIRSQSVRSSDRVVYLFRRKQNRSLR